jgi:uncharacterized phage-associated protein
LCAQLRISYVPVLFLAAVMAHDGRTIANFLLDHGDARRRPLTIMSLLKILFFSHAWHLAKTGEPLVGQPFEAWKYGPVSRVVYDQFKGWGSNAIRSRAKVLNVGNAQYEVASHEAIEPATADLLRHVFDYYSQYHPFRLSDLTHEKGSPWEVVWSEATRRAVPGMVISDESIRDWFQDSRSAVGDVGDRRWYL